MPRTNYLPFILVPKCHKCGHLVEHVSIDPNYNTNGAIITVICHGRKEQGYFALSALLKSKALYLREAFNEQPYNEISAQG